MVEQPALGPGETLISTIRHGLTEPNRDKRVGGRIDLPLIDEGRRQAQEARRGFNGTLFDVIVSCSGRSGWIRSSARWRCLVLREGVAVPVGAKLFA